MVGMSRFSPLTLSYQHSDSYSNCPYPTHTEHS